MANGYWTNHGQLTEAELAAVQLAVANGIATYAAGEIEKLAGIPNIAPLLALAEVNAYPRTFHISQSSATILRSQKVVGALNTYSGTFTASRPAANTLRIAHATQAHGMGAASDGKYLWVKTSAGVATGIYLITTRGTDPNQIEVDVGAAQDGLITSTTVTEVSRVNVYFPAQVHSIPAGVPGPNGVTSFHYALECLVPATTTRYHRVAVGTNADGTGGATVGVDGSVTNTQYGFNSTGQGPAFVNINDVAVQRGFGASGAQTVIPTSHTINTDAQWYASIGIKLGDVDVWAELLYSRVEIKPGL